MYELMQAAAGSFYIDCPAKIGVVKTSDDEVVFIDSGSDKDAGKKALRAVTEKGWKLKASDLKKGLSITEGLFLYM